MTKPIDDMSKYGQAGMDGALKMWGDWGKGWQAITAEMTDYTKRSFEESAQVMEKLMTAKSIDQVVEIQSGYAKRCYDEYVQQMSRIGSMYSDLAKDATKPFEKAAIGRR